MIGGNGWIWLRQSVSGCATRPHIALTAVDPGQNIARAYHVDCSVDLFDWHMVCWSWGRISYPRPPKTRAFPSEAIGFVRQLLARRAGAPARIGVAYKASDERNI